MTATARDDVTVYPARTINSANVRERCFRTVVVTVSDAGDVRVRWRIKADARAWRWKCDLHGATAAPDCACSWSAAIHLAEHLLGLTRIPALEPAKGTSR